MTARRMTVVGRDAGDVARVNPAEVQALGEALRPHMDQIRAALPEGTHFGLFVQVPRYGVAAMMTDRHVMTRAVADWCVGVLPHLGSPRDEK